MRTLLIAFCIAITSSAFAQHHNGNREDNDLFLRLDSVYLYYNPTPGEELELMGSNLFVYDTQGRLIENLYYDNIPSLATYEENITYTLNAEGHVISYLSELTDLSQGSTNPNFLVENEYNNLGQLILSDESYFDETWWPTSRTEYTYDAEGRVISETWSEYVEFDDSYQLYSASNFIYGDNGSYTSETYYYFGSNEPTSGFQTVVTRNSSGILETVVRSEWDTSTNEWVMEKSQIPTYDSNGNIIQLKSNVIEDDNTGMQVIELMEFQYDMDYTFDQAIMPFNDATALTPDIFNILLPQNLPTQFETRYLTPQTEQLIYIADRQVLYYNEVDIVNVPEVNNDQLTIYPNPANDAVYLSFKNPGQVQLELYDMAGQRVQSTLIANNGWLSTATLPNGIYLYKAQQNNVAYTGKLVVQH
ncbi:MAG: T9SS type A sorting domain-containing protein [Flavobacteriales bacterium]|jgi:YD repeat-containing protein